MKLSRNKKYIYISNEILRHKLNTKIIKLYNEKRQQNLWDIGKAVIPSNLKDYGAKIRKILAKLTKRKYINKINLKSWKK